MYKTKIIERFGSQEMVAEAIDNLANEMFKEGYELVTYCFLQTYEDIMVTFKKIEK